MANTLPIQRHNISVYQGEKFLGYVSSVSGIGTSVIVNVSNKRYGFPKRKSESIYRSTHLADICNIFTESGPIKLYPSKDNIRFELIKEDKDE